MTQAAVARTSADFTLSFVLNALVQAKLLTPSQAQDVRTKEQAARARVLKQVGADKDEARYTVSPIEVVAAFQVPLAGGRTLDQDKISEVIAAAAGVGYTQCYNVLEGFQGDKNPQGHRDSVGGWRFAGLPWHQS